MDINDFSLVKIRKTLPFSLDTKQVIYIEKEHNERLDKSIQSVDSAKNLIHLRSLAESFLENGVMDYYNPSHGDVSFDHLYDWFLDNVVDSSEITHGLLNYTGSQNKDVYFCYFINLPSDYDVSNIENMPDFHKELFSIYNHIIAFSDNEEIKNAISRLCDPTDNSMIEKCSRIKQVFTNLFDKDLAEYYIVSGGRNVKKHIKLDASMVSFISSKYKPSNK